MARACSPHAAADEGAPLQDAPPVFIDTNIDTHIALAVSVHDTVADLKRKARVEHVACFPKMGEINVLAIKMRRRAAYYHLSDAMLAKTAFEGIKGTWFLQMDVSPVPGDSNVLEARDLCQSPRIQIASGNQLCASDPCVEGSTHKNLSAGSLGDPENLRDRMDVDANDPQRCIPLSQMDDDRKISEHADDEEHGKDNAEEQRNASGVEENIPLEGLVVEKSKRAKRERSSRRERKSSKSKRAAVDSEDVPHKKTTTHVKMPADDPLPVHLTPDTGGDLSEESNGNNAEEDSNSSRGFRVAIRKVS